MAKKSKGKGKAKAVADDESVSAVSSGDETKPPVKGKEKANTTSKPAIPIRLSKEAFVSMLNMAKSNLVAEDLAKKKGNKMFEEMTRKTGSAEAVDEAEA
ncbi:unnamed protein product [Rhizoctonia solani]|uniref:Uncharacterized protein n=1 Tax=Rhizoctonia solani TaxID=456999 RepID=A0A8H3AWT9_9AGAM|nr:unnamed protein product [Rhizoctonia solani]